MLTYDALLAHAKEKGMPAGKFRGIVREYLHVLILKALYKSEAGRKLYFTGGTYLRLVHGLKRFSEELDFNTADINRNEFECVLDEVRKELKRVNIDSRLTFSHWRNIYSAHLLFPTIEKSYNVKSPYSKRTGIMIKIETNRPKWRIRPDTHAVSGFGEMYPVICTQPGALFADKVDALVRKSRARHLYDVIFMLSRDFPIDHGAVAALKMKDDPLDIIGKRVAGLSESELRAQAEVLRPFLFEESEAGLIIKAHDIIPVLISTYQSIKSG